MQPDVSLFAACLHHMDIIDSRDVTLDVSLSGTGLGAAEMAPVSPFGFLDLKKKTSHSITPRLPAHDISEYMQLDYLPSTARKVGPMSRGIQINN